MAQTLTQEALRKAKRLGIYFLALLALLFLSAIVGESIGVGEQNQPAWALIFIIYTLPAWILVILVVAFISAYLTRRVPNMPEWPGEGTATYLKELAKAEKYLKKPVRVDIYSRQKNLPVSEIEDRISNGELKGYVYRGRLFVDDEPPSIGV